MCRRGEGWIGSRFSLSVLFRFYVCFLHWAADSDGVREAVHRGGGGVGRGEADAMGRGERDFAW